MKGFASHLLCLCAVSSIATAASANVTAVVTTTTGSIKVKGSPQVDFSGAGQIDANLAGSALTGGGIQSTSQIVNGLIEFQNGVITGGPGGASNAFTEVAVTFKNTSNHSVIPILDSTLLPAGLGFLISDIASDTGPGLCSPDGLANCGQTGKGADWSNVSVASAGFQFDILDGLTPLYSLAGSMTVDAHGNIIEDLVAARSALANFGLDTVPGDTSAIGYSWDATNVSLTLASLGAGQSRTLTYRVSTFANSSGSCAPVPGSNAFNKTCIVAYSVFGDPVRSGGVIGALTTPDLAAALSLPPLNAAGPVTGIAFNTLSPLFSPSFDSNTGKLGVFQETAGPVPEPASWAMMISGFGLVGGALRRRSSHERARLA